MEDFITVGSPCRSQMNLSLSLTQVRAPYPTKITLCLPCNSKSPWQSLKTLWALCRRQEEAPLNTVLGIMYVVWKGTLNATKVSLKPAHIVPFVRLKAFRANLLLIPLNYVSSFWWKMEFIKLWVSRQQKLQQIANHWSSLSYFSFVVKFTVNCVIRGNPAWIILEYNSWMLTHLLSPVTSLWMHHCEHAFGSRTASLIIIPKKPTVVNYLSQHIAFKLSSSLNQLWNNVSILIELLRMRTLLQNRNGKILPNAILIFKYINCISFSLYQNSYSLGIKLGNLSRVH